MSRSRGRRYDENPPKLNMKKVIATIITIIVLIMIIISLKKILTPSENVVKEDIVPITYISVFNNDKWGVIDNKGNIIVPISYDEMVIIPDSSKDLFVCTYEVNYENETFKTKVINGKGTELFKDYQDIKAIENSNGNKVWYENNVLKFSKDGKFGLIDFEGKEIVAPEYDNIYALQGIEKSVILEKNGKKGLFNTVTGQIIINSEYVDIYSLSKTYDNGFIVKNDENKYGIIASDKSQTVKAEYDEIKNITNNNYYVVVRNGELKVIDSNEREILKSGFDGVSAIEVDNFIVTKNGKYGLMNKDGKLLIGYDYDDLKFSIADTLIAKKDGKYGIIDNNNNIKVEFKFENINYQKEADFFEAEAENYYTSIIDRNFNIVLEKIIISDFNLEGGYFRARIGDEYKYYNFKLEEKNSKEVLTSNTLFLVKSNGKYGYENKNGEMIVDAIYDDAKEQNQFGYCAVKKDGKWGALKSDGTVVVNPSRDLDNNLYIDFIDEWHVFNELNIYTK